MNTITTTSTMTVTARLIRRGFTPFFLGLGALSLYLLNFNAARIFTGFVLPYYVLGLLLQFVLPKTRAPLEKGELVTDLLSNIAILLVTVLQNAMVAFLFSYASSSLFISAGIISPAFALSHHSLVLQILASVLVFDFFFYVTHRLCHRVPFLWRFHAVHHSAHRITFLNANRAHPLDIMFRRLLPIFIVLQMGISQEALVGASVIGTILATVTHLNIDLKHGWMNYIIGTNEVHRWHHSTNYDEAKNFGVILLWDHIFGTFYFPKDREMPEKMGIADEADYPVHNYFKQLIVPFLPIRRKTTAEEPVAVRADSDPVV